MPHLRGLPAAAGQEGAISTALPCRISLYEEGGRTVLATIKPTALLGMFGSPQLMGVAREVEDAIVRIMQESLHG